LSEYLGDFIKGVVVPMDFNSSEFGTGNPSNVTGLVLRCVAIGSAPGSSFTAGITKIEAYDGLVGLADVYADTSNAAFVVGNDYRVYCSAGTIGTVSLVGKIVGKFSLENRSISTVLARLPTALSGGNMKTVVQSVSASALTDILSAPISQPTAPFSWGTATLGKIVGWLGAMSRNRLLQTTTEQTLRNDSNTADIAVSSIADDGVTYTRGKFS